MKILAKLFFLLVMVVPILNAQFSGSVKIAVISDDHLYNDSLGNTGSAFQKYLASDRKLLAESEFILQRAVTLIEQNNPNILIVSGDLTKDGELVNHQLFASYLAKIKTALPSIKIIVVPGNHDIKNPDAARYSGDSSIAIANITPAQFKSIYANAGYSDAIASDDSSLSYVTEPVSGLWVIAMDACRYKENTTSPVTGGKFNDATLNWINARIKEGKSKNKVVIGVMHHGILEHYTGQATFFPEYVVANYAAVGKSFADNGMNVVLTGHYHAQDITYKKFSSGSTLYDIETGSLVTYPCPVRFITASVTNNYLKLSITSKVIDTVNYNTGGKSWPVYADSVIYNGLIPLADSMLVQGYHVSQATGAYLAPFMAKAMRAHYIGDETPDAATVTTISTFLSDTNATTKLFGQFLGTLWTDLKPGDNNVVLDSIPLAVVTGVKPASNTIPKQLELSQNYPNPFNPNTTILFSVPQTGKVLVEVFSILGQRVAVLADGMYTAGSHKILFDGTSLASGCYFYRLVAGNQTITKKLILMK